MKHEQSVADEFNKFLRKRAELLGQHVHSFSLDGQDRDAGADYLLTDASRFALVEFKSSATDLMSEKLKDRRLRLCQELEHRHDMRSLHDLCHFIAWSSGEPLSVQLNIYRHEICNRLVFGSTCGLSENSPNALGRASAGSFATEFLMDTHSRSLSLQEFETYLAWLLTETSGSARSTLELLISSPDLNDLTMFRFSSVAAAQTWLQTHFPPAPAPRRPQPGI
jgi:hypothetical protein